MIAPHIREENSPHRLMNPNQSNNAQRYPQNSQFLNRSERGSSSSSSGSETSSSPDSSSDESGMETDSSNLVALSSSNTSNNSNAQVSNSHANSIDPEMAMLHSTHSNTVGNEEDPTIPPPNLPVQPAASTSSTTSSSSNQSQTDGFKRTLGEICHRMVFQSPSTHAVTGREKEISDIGKSKKNPFQ